MLTQKDGRYFLMTRLFSQDHRYTAKKKLDDGFINCKTGESLNGKTYPGLILPLELGRAYHEDEYFKFGKIQSAKLLAKETNGIKEFFIHAAFEFSPEIIETKTIIGLDRGAARIGTGTLIDMEGHCLKTGIHLDGDRFRLEMDNHQKRIQLMQKRGIQRSRRFSVRGKRSDIILGEFANQLINLALEHQSQIIIEAIKGTTMGKFLKQSQFTRLKDLLTYKAQRVGLPDPIEVPAAYTSQTCSKCGYKDPLNRPKKDEKGKPLQDRFLCLRCGFKENADTNASHIIALRGLHQLQMGGRYQKFSTFEMWLKNHIGLDNEKLDTFHQ
jgi:transposase